MTTVKESNPLINKMISSLGELPSSPKIVSAVMRLTSDPDTDLIAVEKLLSSDQSMAAKLLKLSNSSFYGQRKNVSTLKQAIIIIGFYTLRSLVVATSIHSMYGNKNTNKSEQKLWEHSLATAMACRLIAKKIGHFHVEEIFMAGLLHDIGKLVLIQKLGPKYESVCTKVEKEHLEFIKVEQEQLGFTHVDVGMMLLSKWNLPQALINAVHKHHAPELQDNTNLESIEPKKIPIDFILEFGNHLAKQIGRGFSDYRSESLEQFPLASALDLTAEDIDEMIEMIKSEFDYELSLFEA